MGTSRRQFFWHPANQQLILVTERSITHFLTLASRQSRQCPTAVIEKFLYTPVCFNAL
jgi:hypothetical protein